MAELTTSQVESWEDSQPERRWENTWYFNCLFSLIFYTAGYWVCLQINLPVWNVYLYSSIGSLFLALLCIIWSWIRLYYLIGIMPTFFHSTVVKPSLVDNQVIFSLAPGTLHASLAGCLALLIGLGTVMIPYYFPDSFPLANLVIVTSPVMVSILVLTVYRELLSLCQTLGICIITSALVVKYSYEDLRWTHTIFAFGIGVMLIMQARMLLTKECEMRKLDCHTSAILILIFKNVLAIFTWTGLWTFGIANLDHSLECWTAGILIGLGDYTFTEGLMKGKAGPAASIISISHLLISGSNSDHNLGILQKTTLNNEGDIISISLIVLGLIILILGDSVCYCAFCSMFERRVGRTKTTLVEPLIEESVIIS